MTEKFLKAKHWQLFLLTFGIPLIFQIITMAVMISNIDPESNADSEIMHNSIKFFPIIMIVVTAIFFGWFWSIAIGLQYKVPENVKMKVKKFKTLFFIPLIYIFLLSIYIAIGANGGLKTENGLNKGMIYGIAGIFILLHLFSMFGIFYTLYFVSKTFKTIELQRKVEFSDFAGEFLMLWFYPIGIWIIQPKINKMIEKNNTTANNV